MYIAIFKSPRAKKKVFQYVSKRQKTESGTEKAALVKELTSLKSDGGILDGGDHKDTYNCKLLQKIIKKEQKKEKKKKAQLANDTNKWLGIQKMIATKKKKKAEAAVEASAAASSSGRRAAALPNQQAGVLPAADRLSKGPRRVAAGDGRQRFRYVRDDGVDGHRLKFEHMCPGRYVRRGYPCTPEVFFTSTSFDCFRLPPPILVITIYITYPIISENSTPLLTATKLS